MKIEIRETKVEGLVCITSLDERFYRRTEDGKDFKSSSWVAGYTPKGIGYWKWLADKGWDEAEAIKLTRGNYGSKVHQAVEQMLKQKKETTCQP